MLRIALLIVAVAAVLGSGAAYGARGAAPETQLRISFWPEGRGTGEATTWTLRCEPAGGTLPRAAAACRQLYAMTAPFAPVRRRVFCTDQYGGPQQALIAGTYRGSRVWTMLALRNGCEISRAKRLRFLVPGLTIASASS